MALDFNTALFAKAELVKITGVQDLANLEADSELDLDDLILEATREAFSRVRRTGMDPALITNQVELRSAVAYMVLERLAMGGYIDPLDDRATSIQFYKDKVKELLREFRPTTTEDDAPSNIQDGVPSVGNFEPGWVFADVANPLVDRFSRRIPQSRNT